MWNSLEEEGEFFSPLQSNSLTQTRKTGDYLNRCPK
jgi:hypothetical protein